MIVSVDAAAVISIAFFFIAVAVDRLENALARITSPINLPFIGRVTFSASLSLHPCAFNSLFTFGGLGLGSGRISYRNN